MSINQTRAWVRRTKQMAPSTQLKKLAKAGVGRELTFVEGEGLETLELCLQSLRKGDTLAVAGIEMLHRTTDGIYAALRVLQDKGVGLRVLDEDRTIAPENLADVRLGIEVRSRLAGERHRFTSESGRQAALKRHDRISKADMQARWKDTTVYPTVPEALAGTGWSERGARLAFGPRGTAIRRKK